MTNRDIVVEVEARCGEILNSPYLRQKPPIELQKLRTLLLKIDTLTREEVPALITEVKRLRTLNRRLEAEMEAMRQPVQQSSLAEREA
jgi:hypothetical protein